MRNKFEFAVTYIFITILALISPCAKAAFMDGDFESAAPGAINNSTYYYLAGESIDNGNWYVLQGKVGVDTNGKYNHEGNKSIFLDANVGPNSLIQNLTTTAGMTYTISFYGNADTANSFSASFGGIAIAGFPTSIAMNGFASDDHLGNSSSFVHYVGTATATSTITALIFSATNTAPGGNNVTVEIDSISVAPAIVPEPSSLALCGIAGLASLSLAHVRRRLVAVKKGVL